MKEIDWDSAEVDALPNLEDVEKLAASKFGKAYLAAPDVFFKRVSAAVEQKLFG